jgi:protein-tyrosine phosphatase
MIDFHSHVLFDVDDGSKSLEMSIAMIEQSIGEGVTTLAITPHHIKDLFEDAMTDKQKYIEKFDLLQQKFLGRIELIPSVEIMINNNIFEDLRSGLLFGYNHSKTILVEYNLMDYPLYSEGLFYKLKKEGYQVILAHPERNKSLRDDPDKLYHLNDLGVLFQLNAGSLLGHFGDKTEVFARKLIEKNLVHAIGSDGHNDVKRDMRIRHVYETIREVNQELYDNIMINGPKLIKGYPVEVLPYKEWSNKVRVKKRKRKKKSLLDFFNF